MRPASGSGRPGPRACSGRTPVRRCATSPRSSKAVGPGGRSRGAARSSHPSTRRARGARHRANRAPRSRRPPCRGTCTARRRAWMRAQCPVVEPHHGEPVRGVLLAPLLSEVGALRAEPVHQEERRIARGAECLVVDLDFTVRCSRHGHLPGREPGHQEPRRDRFGEDRGPRAPRFRHGFARGPNLVVIMSDQHRADLMGCAGASGVLTPNLDALASEGIRFSRVSCQGPLCMPARASFMTERYVRDHGVYTNWAESRPRRRRT